MNALQRLLLAAGAACSLGTQAAGCWIDAEHPKTADNLAVSDPRVAPMRATARRINALIHANATFAALPHVRLRTRWQISGETGAPARGLWLQARDHRQPMWVGECGVLEGADRWPPQASIVVQVNQTQDLFNGPPEIRDGQLTAWREPVVKGAVGGHPLYHGWLLVFTASGRPPWVAVTQAEYLDAVERDWAALPALLAQARALRASLTPEQAAGPARVGWNGLNPEVPPERYPTLVKLDPAFPWSRDDRQRPQLLSLSVLGSGPHEAAMQQVLQTLDLGAFQALVRNGR